MLQKCSLLFKIVTVSLPGVLSEGSSVSAHDGQTPGCMDKQGVVNVFVPLLSRANFPFPLKKQTHFGWKQIDFIRAQTYHTYVYIYELDFRLAAGLPVLFSFFSQK